MTFRTVIIGGDAAGMSAATRVRGAAPGRRGRRAGDGAGSRATRRAASRSSSAALVAGGVEALVARIARRAPPARHRRAHPPRGDGHRPRRRRGRVPRRARRHDRPHRLRRAADRHRRRADPPRPARHRPAVRPRRAVARRRPGAAVAGRRRGAGGSSSSAAATSAWRWPRRTSSGAARRRSSSGRPQPLGVVDADFGAARRRRHARRTASTSAAASASRASSRAPCSRPTARSRPTSSCSASACRPRSELAAAAGIELGAGGRRSLVDERQATSRRRRLVGRRLRHVDAPGHRRAGAHRPRHLRQQARPGRRHQHGRRRRPRRRRCSARRSPSCARWRSPSPACASTQALDAGFDAVATTVDTTTVAGYLPHADADDVRLVAERGTGRVLGAQIIGGPGSAKRIDTVATAITAGMTVADVADLDLAYAPPFSSVWDPVAVAARRGAQGGLTFGTAERG